MSSARRFFVIGKEKNPVEIRDQFSFFLRFGAKLSTLIFFFLLRCLLGKRRRYKIFVGHLKRNVEKGGGQERGPKCCYTAPDKKKTFPSFSPPPFSAALWSFVETKKGGTNQRAEKGGKRKAKQLFASAPKAIHMPPLPCFSFFLFCRPFVSQKKSSNTQNFAYDGRAAGFDKKGFLLQV